VILSDQGSAAMKHSHIQAKGRKRSEMHQITVQQLWNTVTYNLKAGRVRKASDHCLTAIQHSHIHAEGRKRSENYQITVQQLWNTVTYKLRAGRGHKTIRSMSSSYETQSHTIWGQEEVRQPSDHCSAAMKHSHIHPEGRKRSKNHQTTVQQLWNAVTYILRAGKGQKTIRSLFSSYTTQSHTIWGQVEVRKPSDQCSAAMKYSHIQAEGRKRPENHQTNVQ